MSTRQIRLKEHSRGQSKAYVPTEAIRAASDRSLGPGPFIARADADGFLATGNNVSAELSAILMLGGSFVESMYSNQTRRFPSQIERSLAGVGRDHRVLNGGYSGMTTLHLLQLLSAKVPTVLRPGDRVLIFIGQSDATALQEPGYYWSADRRVSPFAPKADGGSLLYSEWREALTRVVESVAAVACSLGVEVAFASSPFRDGEFSTDSVIQRSVVGNYERYSRVVEIRRSIGNVTEQIASKYNIPYFPGHTIMMNYPRFFYDLMHLNGPGQDYFSTKLFNWIITDWL